MWSLLALVNKTCVKRCASEPLRYSLINLPSVRSRRFQRCSWAFDV
jgi:hypothetical protein